MAYAGRDPESLSEQVDSQANELLSYVQDQNKDIDQRQAELNAKLAQLDSQLRSARLQGVDDVGTDLLADQPSRRPPQVPPINDDPQGYVAEETSVTRNEGDHPDSTGIDRFPSPESPRSIQQEFDEVDRIVAEFSDLNLDNTPASEVVANDDLDSHQQEQQGQCESTAIGTTPGDEASTDSASDLPPRATETTAEQPTSDTMDAFPSMLAQSHWGRLDSRPSSDADILASERGQLAERQLEVEREKSVVRRLHDEAQALYREALEMRLVTEQLWHKLSALTPPDKVEQHIADLRTRLETHYAAEHAALASRREDLQSLQQVLEEKQAALRDQSARMQDWFTTRDEQIRSYSNEIDVRSSLLDRREQRLQDEVAKWQTQRKDYEHQLQSLAQKLKLNGVLS